ncbi:iron/manganese transporter [Arachidicoccus ginsenosidimutans]|uniref:Nramp family divalent metal transporter n=1 Tax=Arachidicoccus sp. BS20 TaxID=1850526 RepID=UPI0007F0A3E6|nr:Nramp family divalent metal transporter [Arachidicoccus sp. BS20]ANI88608.1 iron/manganese transporter [Arachidicoccus sp. BS20]
MNKNNHSASLSDVHQSVDTTKARKGFRKILAFLGPAYLVSVGYMDPGNWATDLQGGAQFGYKLIWVLLMSNLIALLLQNMSARLGVVREQDLAQINRSTYPKFVNIAQYVLAEFAIAACDLAEVLGMAIGIHLLTGLPILWGVCITIFDTFILFFLQKLGMRKMELFIIGLIAITGLSFLVELILAKPDAGDIVLGFVPHKLSSDELYIAVGIIGATVMPHNLYLHSALVQTRRINRSEDGIKKALKYNTIDGTIALNLAFLVNAAILIMAASVFFKTGHTGIAKIEDAHQMLAPLLGTKLAPTLFAIALIAAGQSSTITGTLAGQIVMEGYLHLRINPLLRRLITRLLAIIPALAVILIYGDKELDQLLILSQVILSVQLGFAIVPLIYFVSDKQTMGQFAIPLRTKMVAWLIAAVLVYLNAKLVADEINELFSLHGYLFAKMITLVVTVALIVLFAVTFYYPMKKRKVKIMPQRL